MDPFVRKLVLRLLDESAPLSRNRHFHTFESQEGKRALLIARRLKSLQSDIAKCAQAGGDSWVAISKSAEGTVQIELWRERLRSARLTTLDQVEFELLCLLPGMRTALEGSSAHRSERRLGQAGG